MIINAAGTMAVSNLGWIDKGSLWTYSLGESEPRQVFLSDSVWLSIVQGTGDYFALAHQDEENSARLTAHSFANVANVISSIELQGSSIESTIPYFAGDTSVWSFLPKAYIARAATTPFLLLVDRVRSVAQVQPLPWYEESYDSMYQGILGVTEIPASSYLLISIQRDSRPVLYDPATRIIVKKLELAERHGNPQLYFRRRASELWASDYDTIIKLNSVNWNVLDALKLQEAQGDMTRLFIGSYCFNAEESICAVARPYSGDVVAIDPDTFKVSLRAQIGSQPEDVDLLRDNCVVARDWRTGRLLQGALKPI